MVMNDCDKIIAVLYIPIGCGLGLMTDVQEHLISYFDETVKTIVVPLYSDNAEPRFEVVNPRYVSKEEYKKLTEKVNKYLDDFNSHKK